MKKVCFPFKQMYYCQRDLLAERAMLHDLQNSCALLFKNATHNAPCPGSANFSPLFPPPSFFLIGVFGWRKFALGRLPVGVTSAA